MPATQEITVSVAGVPRKFSMGRLVVGQALGYIRTQARIAQAMREACADIADEEQGLALATELYLHGVAPMLAEVILRTPADDGPPLEVTDVWAFEPGEPMRVQAVFEDFVGITALAAKAQELLQDARAIASRRLQARIDQLAADPAPVPDQQDPNTDQAQGDSHGDQASDIPNPSKQRQQRRRRTKLDG